MTRLEDELRNTFAARVIEVPEVRDVAGSAIERGRSVRRRQRLGAGAAFAVVIALVVAGTSWVRAGHLDGRPGRQGNGVAAGPARATPDASPQLDVVVGGELRPAGHAPIALPGMGDVYDAVRVSEGWLVVRGDKATHKLWLVRAQGSPTLVIDGLPSNFAFSPDGRRIAYQQGSSLTVADISGGVDKSGVGVQLPGHDGSQGRTGAELVGWAGRYLVIGNRLGLDYDGYDVWDPAQGGYVPTWNHEVVGVYAATPDGGSLVGAVKDPNLSTPCAAMFDPAAGLPVRGKICGQPSLSPSRHALSPDGYRFIGRAAGGFGIGETRKGTVIAPGAAAEGTWPADPVWTANDTFVVPEENRILYVNVADPQHPRELPTPSTSERWLVVPRVGG